MENKRLFVLLPMRILLLCFLSLLLSAVALSKSNAVIIAYPTADTLYGNKFNNTNTVFACPIEVLPQFPGGYIAQKKFIAARIYFPKGTENIQGRVILNFKIDKYGFIDSITVARRLHPQLDSIAINIVKEMPRWEPALLLGQPTEARMTLPVKFTFE